MRMAVDCEVRNPVARQLPAVFQGDLEASGPDGLLAALVEAFDRALAPALLVLDDLGVYLDPYLTPDDFLPWLLTWLAVPDDRSRTTAERRRIAAHAAGLYRGSGTRGGLREQLVEVLGWDVDVEENGATLATTDPDAALPGAPSLGLHVRVHAPAGIDVGDAAIARRVASIVQTLKPAHVPHTVEIVAASGDSAGSTPSSSSTPS
jgi:phage tail-like protein